MLISFELSMPKRGPGIGDPSFRQLTGGYSSQSIDAAVLRKLAERAGIRKNIGR